MAFDYSTVDLESILRRAYDQMDDLQRPGVAKARKSGRVMLHMWMGTGKTLTGLTAGLCFRPQTWLIIGSKNSLNAWRQEIKKWFPEFGDDALFQVVRGTEWERQAAYKKPALFYATTGGAFIRDIAWLQSKKVKFDVITVDEPQLLGFRNYKTATFKAFKALIQHIEKKNKHPIKLIEFTSGTWTSKGNPQQWPILHLLEPKLFSSYWRFVHMFNIVIATNFGKQIVGPQNTMALAEATHHLVHTISEEDAKESLPELRRSRLPVELPSSLWKMYDTMAEELYMVLEGGSGPQLISVSNALAASMKLRQLITCPAMISPELGLGPAIEAIGDKIEESEGSGNWLHNVVFCPFLKPLPLFKDYLSERFKIPPTKIYIMQGGMEIEEVQAVELAFRTDPESMVLCSTSYSSSFNLETARSMYHVHFEWDQDKNKQADARGRRKDGTQPFINSYYVSIANTISEDMLDVLNQKEYINRITYQDIAALKERLRRKFTERQ